MTSELSPILPCIYRASAAELPQSEYMALYDLYYSTNGSAWEWREGTNYGIPWDFAQSSDPCIDRWQGIVCSNETGTDHVVFLYLSDYNLNGTIPATIGDLLFIRNLDLSTNHLMNSIPTDIVQLSYLIKLDLSHNRLSGPLPPQMEKLVGLEELILSENDVSGPVGAIGSHLRELYLDANKFSYLSSSIGDSLNLEYLILNNNIVSGTIPVSLWSLLRLEYLYLQENSLYGVLNELLAQAVFVQNLNLSTNRLSGSLPSTLGSLTQMHQLYLSNNYFTGTIPASIGNASQLSQFDLSGTRIGGVIPTTMRNLTHLITLSLQTGLFQGSLEHVFSAAQTNLTAIQLDNNQFTGTLPAALFDLPSLATVSIVGSCITGTLPDNVCNARDLQALVMYGLTTGVDCRRSGSQTLHSWKHATFGGAFPACLLALPKIRTIFLSSNGLTGSMHSDWHASPTLTQLDLSHNALSGSIPSSIQHNAWSLLDLSHNKLSGSLHPGLFAAANASADLSLDTNRLSGDIPKSIRSVQDISVLAGNLFACDLGKRDLPEEDSSVRTYNCASNSFNIAIFIWLGLCIAAGVVVYHNYTWLLSLQLLQLPDNISCKLGALHTVFERCHELSKYSWCCAGYCMVVLLPYYAILSHYKGTHTHQYAYIVSAIYTSGVAAFVCNFTLFTVLLSALYVAIGRLMSSHTTISAQSDANTWFKRVCIWVIFASINTAAVLGVNYGYVNIILSGSSQGQAVAQVALSIFKLAWGATVAPFLIRRLELFYFPECSDSSESFFVLQLIVALFNNIAIPCLVVAAIDPNCFKSILLPPEAQTVDYMLPVCYAARIEEQCTSFVYQPAELTFTPPFVYSYQCSASFITSYAPAFMYMSISTVFIVPALDYAWMRLRARKQPADGVVYSMLFYFMPRILRPLEDGPTSSDFRRRPYVRALGTTVNILAQMGILLTFGVIFPPVALAMAVSIASMVYTSRAKAQRFLLTVVEANRLEYLDVINAECVGVGTAEQMVYSVEILVCFCCAFYALFLFDALGDTEGFSASIWVVIVVPLVPYSILGLSKIITAIRTTTRTNDLALQNNANQVVHSGDANEMIHIVNALHESKA